MGMYDSLFRVTFSNEDYCETSQGTNQLALLVETLKDIPCINVAIDQSTSQIGVAIADASNDKLLMLGDLQNLGFPSKYEFKQYFLHFMQNNFEGRTIQYFFYEIPVEHASNLYSRRALNDLMAFVEEMPQHIQSLKQARMLACNNLVWKSHFLKDPRYKGRRKRTEDVKLAAAEEALARFPWIHFHLQHFSKPADSCDAIGILYGAFEEMRSPSLGKQFMQINRLMPNGPAVKNYTFTEAVSIEQIPEFIKREFHTESYTIVEFNPNMDIKENIQRWCRNNRGPACIIVLNPKAEQIVRWESKIDKEPGQLYAIFTERLR